MRRDPFVVDAIPSILQAQRPWFLLPAYRSCVKSLDFFEVFIAVLWLQASTPERWSERNSQRTKVRRAGQNSTEQLVAIDYLSCGARTRETPPCGGGGGSAGTSDREKNEASGCLTTLGYVRPFLVGGQVVFMFGSCA